MAEVNLDGGSVDMHTEATEAAIAGIGSAGAGFQAAWQGLMSELDRLEQLLGKGPMGEAFAAQYNGPAEALKISAGAIEGHLTQIVDAGNRAVALYLEADARGKRALGG
ncbi:hypothetical protein ALI22I_01490 [Saccharothrix sp. ALI-22-I]|uniref:hypothetical protein n=1 Tax=Saccharothrix sp. ALI-22-I TaxID=1933778 RepID=UPI00097C870A|nr:hypothetical protein [Saccharothrix sp. ALI-22-I]ONI92878.1 hypothetical protein ALI22I_01490 [Saccharothrix sp. ALI-22-I]